MLRASGALAIRFCMCMYIRSYTSPVWGWRDQRKELMSMSTMLPPHRRSFEVPQLYASQYGTDYVANLELEQPKVRIRGDIRLYVTEAEAALHPITGRYSVEMAGMQEPLHFLWYAEGQILGHQALTAEIAFDMRDARAGEIWTYLVALQVTESGVQGRVVQSGVFVQIAVHENFPRQAA